MEKVKLKVTTLTPVAIGSGKNLSPYLDYVIDKGEVCIIDKTRLVENIMAKDDKLLDDFVSGIANGIDQSKTKSSFELIKFLKENDIVNNLDDIISSRSILIGDSNKNYQ